MPSLLAINHEFLTVCLYNNELKTVAIFQMIFSSVFIHTKIGVCHSDELIYFFIYPFASIPSGLNASETELSHKMLQTWTNFVKYG